MVRSRRLAPLLLLISIAPGCAKYNYDLLQPEPSRMRVGDDWQHLSADPIAYRFRSVENHLVIQIYNTTDAPMRLLGDRSYIVTPSNQSIPLQTQTIAPASYVKLVLPPLQQMIRPGPSIGFGVGYSTGRASPPLYNPGFTEPTYLYVENPSTYWEWDDESDATLHLVFEQSAKTFDQTFVFHRVKV